MNERRVDPEMGIRAHFISETLLPCCRETPRITEVLPLLAYPNDSRDDLG